MTWLVNGKVFVFAGINLHAVEHAEEGGECETGGQH